MSIFMYTAICLLYTHRPLNIKIYIPLLGKVFMDHSQKAKNIEKKVEITIIIVIYVNGKREAQ